MKAGFSIRKSECLKGILVGMVAMLMTLAVWESSTTGNRAAPIPFRQQVTDFAGLHSAVSMYFNEHEGNGLVYRYGVTLETLENEGYLRADTSSRLLPASWRFFPEIVSKSDSSPSSVLVEAQLPSGQHLVLLADGSVQSKN